MRLNRSRLLVLSLLAPTLLLAQSLLPHGVPSSPEGISAKTTAGGAMSLPRSDLRLLFSSVSTLEARIRGHQVVVDMGKGQAPLQVDIGKSMTLKDVFAKTGDLGLHKGYQVRVIQRNRITQSERQTEPFDWETFLRLAVVPGDILVAAGTY